MNRRGYFNISVKTGKMYASYRGISGMYTFVNGHPLTTITQSIPRVSWVKFGESSRELLHTFVFNKLVYYHVIIPGSNSYFFSEDA